MDVSSLAHLAMIQNTMLARQGLGTEMMKQALESQTGAALALTQQAVDGVSSANPAHLVDIVV